MVFHPWFSRLTRVDIFAEAAPLNYYLRSKHANVRSLRTYSFPLASAG